MAWVGGEVLGARGNTGTGALHAGKTDREESELEKQGLRNRERRTRFSGKADDHAWSCQGRGQSREVQGTHALWYHRASLFMPSKSADASIWASASSVGTRWYAALSSVVMLPMHILSFKS